MSDCKLLTILEVPGSLYDTGRGYPIAVFKKHRETKVAGELYIMQDPAKKLRELDEVEMIDSAQYRRIKINHSGYNFFTYEADSGLIPYCKPSRLIQHGNWRRYSSLCFHDPGAFALNFEDRQKFLYREHVSKEGNGLIYIIGDIPLIVTAPHSTVHERMGKLKRQEYYTAALSVMLHSLTGCHVLYTNRLMKSDPNYYDESPFKVRLREIISANKIIFLIDLHGTGAEKDYDVYPGVGIEKEFLLGNESCIEDLKTVAELNHVSLGGLEIFPAAKQMTVTKFAARELKVPSIQLEINRNLRQPDKNPEQFIRLVKMLKELVDSLSNLIG